MHQRSSSRRAHCAPEQEQARASSAHSESAHKASLPHHGIGRWRGDLDPSEVVVGVQKEEGVAGEAAVGRPQGGPDEERGRVEAPHKPRALAKGRGQDLGPHKLEQEGGRGPRLQGPHREDVVDVDEAPVEDLWVRQSQHPHGQAPHGGRELGEEAPLGLQGLELAFEVSGAARERHGHAPAQHAQQQVQGELCTEERGGGIAEQSDT